MYIFCRLSMCRYFVFVVNFIHVYCTQNTYTPNVSVSEISHMHREQMLFCEKNAKCHTQVMLPYLRFFIVLLMRFRIFQKEKEEFIGRKSTTFMKSYFDGVFSLRGFDARFPQRTILVMTRVKRYWCTFYVLSSQRQATKHRHCSPLYFHFVFPMAALSLISFCFFFLTFD